MKDLITERKLVASGFPHAIHIEAIAEKLADIFTQSNEETPQEIQKSRRIRLVKMAIDFLVERKAKELQDATKRLIGPFQAVWVPQEFFDELVNRNTGEIDLDGFSSPSFATIRIHYTGSGRPRVGAVVFPLGYSHPLIDVSLDHAVNTQRGNGEAVKVRLKAANNVLAISKGPIGGASGKPVKKIS
jgi:hypothetical protein